MTFVTALQDQLWAEYVAAVDNDHPTAALAAIEYLHELRPQNTFYGYLRGKALWTIGRCAEAEERLLEAHADFWGRDIEWVEMTLGDVYRDMLRPQEAERWYRQAVASAPGTTAPYIFLAAFLARRERFDEACDVLERARGATGDLDEVNLNLALNRRALGDLERARAAVLSALEITPDYDAARQRLADIDAAIRTREQYRRRLERALRDNDADG